MPGVKAPNGYWQPVPEANYAAGQWNRPLLKGVFPGSLFDPYIAQGTVLTRDVRGTAMPLASRSSDHAQWMVDNLNNGGGFGPTGFNTSQFGTHPIAVYTVDSSAPDADWQYVDSAAAGSGQNQAMVDLYCKGAVPLPHWVVPPSQGDRGLALYDLATGIMREYFYFEQVTGSPLHWKARVAGVSVGKPGLVGMADVNPGAQLRTGGNAVVGMHNPLGFVGIAEVLRGEIGHAIAFTCSNMGRGYSWPARGGDGLVDNEPKAPVEGQWARLPASVNPMFDPRTSLPYNPLTRLIIRAAQRYGMFASDKNLFVHAFNGEHGGQWKQLYGTDPWAPNGILHPIIGGTTLEPASGGFNVQDFPWHLTEWAPVDWGRPSPDFWLRPGDPTPWTA